jgi:hypothetical protein
MKNRPDHTYDQPSLRGASTTGARTRQGRSPLNKLAMGGFAAATLAAVVGIGASRGTSAGPSAHEQQLLSQAVPIAANNVHTTLVKSPVLPRGNFVVDLIIDVDNVRPGADVLCGDATTGTADVVDGNYGVLDNQGTSASVSGTCEVSGTVQIKEAHDHIIGWATVYSGPGGATAGGWSENETRVGNLIVTH